MKVPRNIYGRDLANHLVRRWNFHQLRQTGSHIILRTETPLRRTISIPDHKPIRAGTLGNILDDVAAHKGVSVADILEDL